MGVTSAGDLAARLAGEAEKRRTPAPLEAPRTVAWFRSGNPRARSGRKTQRRDPAAWTQCRGDLRRSGFQRSNGGSAREANGERAGSCASARCSRCARMRSINAGSSILAITRSCPPQRRQRSMSIPSSGTNGREHALESLRPRHRGALGRRFLGRGVFGLRAASSARRSDCGAQRRMRGEHPVVAREMYARRRHERGQACQKVERS